MKTIEEFLGILALRLGDLYQRPLMHGGTTEGVELLLHNYHSLWAEIVEQHDEFWNVWHAVLAEQDCGAANFSTYYARRHPNASEQEILAYVLEHWEDISTRLNIPIQTPAYPAKQQHFCVGDRVQLISFNSTTVPPPDCDDTENYWKLIGSPALSTKSHRILHDCLCFLMLTLSRLDFIAITQSPIHC